MAKEFSVTLSLSSAPDDARVEYLAASPPESRSGFSGSGLPFASPRQAFDHTPNRGTVVTSGRDQRTATIVLKYPNAYYVGLGTVYVPPVLFLSYVSNGARKREAIRLGDGVPFRTLTYPAFNTRPRSSCMFYDVGQLPVRTQEEILRASAYPDKNVMPPNFWGAKPPV